MPLQVLDGYLRARVRLGFVGFAAVVGAAFAFAAALRHEVCLVLVLPHLSCVRREFV